VHGISVGKLTDERRAIMSRTCHLVFSTCFVVEIENVKECRWSILGKKHVPGRNSTKIYIFHATKTVATRDSNLSPQSCGFKNPNLSLLEPILERSFSALLHCFTANNGNYLLGVLQGACGCGCLHPTVLQRKL